MINKKIIFLTICIILSFSFIVGAVFAANILPTPNWFINQTSDWDLGTYVNTSSVTNEYNHTANALELSFPYADKDANLVSYYRFENNANDETGLNSGTLGTGSNAPTYTASGKFDGAYSFDGGDWITGGSTNLNMTSEMTFSVWAKTTVVDTTYDAILSKHNGTSDAYQVGFNAAGSKIYFALYNTSGGYFETVSNNIPSTNTWYHVVGTMNTSNVMNIYINGALQTSTKTLVGTVQANSANLLIGNVTTYPFKGVIDEVKIYNRSLSDTEISTLYNQGDKYINTTKTSPIATWTSSRQNITAGQQLVNLTVNYSSFDQNHYIDRIEVLNYGGTSVANFTGGLAWNSTLLNDANLTGYWQLENNGNDLKGYANNNTVTGATATISGKYGSAYSFANSTNRYINVGNSTSLNITGKNMTISAWIYPTASADGVIVVKSITAIGAAAADPYQEYGDYYSSTNKFCSEISSGAVGSRVMTCTARTVSLNTWSHVVSVYNGTNILNYVNGVQDATVGIQNVTIGTNIRPVLIGAYMASAPNQAYFTGTIDDVAIFNRSLSADEILQIYKNTNKQTVRTINNTDLSSGNLSLVNSTLESSNFTMKLYLKGKGTSTPVINSIIGYYGATIDTTSFYQCYYSNSTGVNITNGITVALGENLRCNDTSMTTLDNAKIINNGNLTFSNFTLQFNLSVAGNGYIYNTKNMTITNSSNITSILTSGSRDYYILDMPSATTIIKNSAIEYAGYGEDDVSGIEFKSPNFRLINNTIFNVFQVYSLDTIGGLIENNTFYTDWTFAFFGGNGIQMTNTNLSSIVNNTFNRTDAEDIFLQGSHYDTVNNNTFVATQLSNLYIDQLGGTGTTGDHVIESNNFITGNSYLAIEMFFSNNVSFRYNNITTDLGMLEAFLLGNDYNNTIDSNIIHGNFGGDGIKMVSTDYNNTISNNQIYNNAGNGIQISGVGSQNNTIINNNLDTNGKGISTNNANLNKYENNVIINTGTDGIYLQSSQNNIINNNNITSTTHDGIALMTDADNNTITNNNFNNSETDIYGIRAESNLIENNTFMTGTSSNRNILLDAEDYWTIINNNSFTTMGVLHDGIVDNSDLITISNNTFNDITSIGVSISGDTNTVYGNDFSGIMDISIDLITGSSNHIYNNTLNGMATGGIYILDTSNIVEQNNLTNTGTDAIFLQFADNSILRYNNINGSIYSFDIDQSDNVILTNNTIYNSTTAYYSTSVTSNTIYNMTVNQTLFSGIESNVEIKEIYDVNVPANTTGLLKLDYSYLNITNTSTNSWMLLNLTYNSTNSSILNPVILRYDGSSWQTTGSSVDTSRGVVYVNTSTFGMFGLFDMNITLTKVSVNASDYNTISILHDNIYDMRYNKTLSLYHIIYNDDSTNYIYSNISWCNLTLFMPNSTIFLQTDMFNGTNYTYPVNFTNTANGTWNALYQCYYNSTIFTYQFDQFTLGNYSTSGLSNSEFTEGVPNEVKIAIGIIFILIGIYILYSIFTINRDMLHKYKRGGEDNSDT